MIELMQDELRALIDEEQKVVSYFGSREEMKDEETEEIVRAKKL